MTQLETRERPFSFRQLNKIIRKLELKDNSIVLVKAGTALAKIDNINELVKAGGRLDVKDILIVVVDDFDDLTVLDEQQMHKHGWWHVRGLKEKGRKTK